MQYIFSSFNFQPTHVVVFEVNFLYTAYSWIMFSFLILKSILLIFVR